MPKSRQKTEIICVLSDKPKIILARNLTEPPTWIICTGMNKNKETGTESAANPSYWGESLAGALKWGYKQIVLKKAKPNSTILDLNQLCLDVADALEIRVRRAMEKIQRPIKATAQPE